MPFLVLAPEYCRARQERLLRQMQIRRLDLVVVTNPMHVQWLTGYRCAPTLCVAAALRADGSCVLVHPETCPPEGFDGTAVAYPAQHLFTLRNDQLQACATALRERLITSAGMAKRVGIEGTTAGPILLTALGDPVATCLESELWQMRRSKLPDELELMKRATDATTAMYDAAKEVIQPGADELTVFNRLQAAAVKELGEMLTGTGNDYQCNSGGGPPRNRPAQAGELYILDLGPAYRGYFADNSRTFAVDGKPTDAQLAAWEKVVSVFDIVERNVKPGTRCRELFAEVSQMLNTFLPDGFPHHLGHGLGLFPHEPPYLNSHWDDVFLEGDVFTVEPGLYGPELKAGMRIENNYRVTATGVELLTPYPLELT